ncbi:CTTNBP2 N-terminal-like protein [Gouania willdenowi]|uniref:Cortactin-binding protein-2 N-terminal domain-containing protein n=1 Tax=Gouania willdenowi TaxID=441366 RepID=A0A8C5HYX4_GOUWI|nr:CTTNBP2 N-terminal-like protein [Gouania willdenowi]
MKSNLNLESLTKPELLMLFSILEGELEARDFVIEELKAKRKELFTQERYGRYSLSDPFQALQRDSEAVGDQNKEAASSSTPANPLVVLQLVVSHCRKMQEKMLAQLSAAENRHRRVIADLEEEKRRHAEDTAEGDDVTYILEKERERLQQQLEFERSQVRRLEKDQWRMSDQLEEERLQHKQLSCALAKECKWASTRALEEGHRVTELNHRLDKEKEACQVLRKELEEERRRALRMEARVEEQLAEFDTEREQLRSRLKKEEVQCRLLQQQVEELQRKLGVNTMKETTEPMNVPTVSGGEQWATNGSSGNSVVAGLMVEDLEAGELELNGHRCTVDSNGHHDSDKTSPHDKNENPSSPSPCSSPVLSKHSPGSPVPGSSFQSQYQAGIHQRFHAARHKFQGTSDLELHSQSASPPVPKEAPPVPESSSVKQMARSTVTQVLSRFTTVHQGPGAPKQLPANSSPFGTDYRSLAAPLSPVLGRVTVSAPQVIKSPTISRADRGNPPPIPPKKPGLAQAPPSPATAPRSPSHFSDSSLTGSCGLTTSQEGVKELDMVVSSN